MAKSWRMVRVPEELAARIDALAARYQKANAAGHYGLPAEFADRLPIHWVLSRALDCLEGHRERRRKARHKARRKVHAP